MRLKIIRVIVGGIVILSAGWWYFSKPTLRSIRFEDASPTAKQQPFSYTDYATVLKAHVNDQGGVNYKELKTKHRLLDTFASDLGKLEPAIYDRWGATEQTAFWINTYNALTLQAILNHYPIEPSFLRSLFFPKNSIRQIPGVWDSLQFLVVGRWMTLGHIEHQILRAQFGEPRIHMALVCASRGCPSLRNEPFAGERLNDQLEDQVQRFLSNPEKFRIDRNGQRVYLSAIFKWFGTDFIKGYGPDRGFPGFGQTERSVLSFISRHLNADDREDLGMGKYKLEYLDYDWSLNEQVTGGYDASGVKLDT
jgi:hypothetical protein